MTSLLRVRVPEWLSREKKPETSPTVVPQPPSAAVLSRQKEIGRGSRGPFAMWFWRGGWGVFLTLAVVVAIGAITLGPALSAEILIGVESPHVASAGAWTAIVRWTVALTGWLAVPAVVGAVVGYFVGAAMSSYRSRTLDEIASEQRLERE